MTSTTSREALDNSYTAAYQAARCAAYPDGRWILTDGDGRDHDRIVVGPAVLSVDEARERAAEWFAANGIDACGWSLVGPDKQRFALIRP